MTITELAVALGPVADRAMKSEDPTVVKIGVVLAAIMGSLPAEDGGLDMQVIDGLFLPARLMCEHRIGLHRS